MLKRFIAAVAQQYDNVTSKIPGMTAARSVPLSSVPSRIYVKARRTLDSTSVKMDEHSDSTRPSPKEDVLIIEPKTKITKTTTELENERFTAEQALKMAAEAKANEEATAKMLAEQAEKLKAAEDKAAKAEADKKIAEDKVAKAEADKKAAEDKPASPGQTIKWLRPTTAKAAEQAPTVEETPATDATPVATKKRVGQKRKG